MLDADDPIPAGELADSVYLASTDGIDGRVGIGVELGFVEVEIGAGVPGPMGAGVIPTAVSIGIDPLAWPDVGLGAFLEGAHRGLIAHWCVGVFDDVDVAGFFAIEVDQDGGGATDVDVFFVI